VWKLFVLGKFSSLNLREIYPPELAEHLDIR
jgi:hypothetical protein